MAKFDLTIDSQKKHLFRGKVDFLNVPAEKGRLTVLARHAPLLALLNSGKAIIKADNVKNEFEIKEGFIEVNEKCVTVLVKE